MPRGRTISAIARHTGRNRKTIRACMYDERTPGAGARAVDPFALFLNFGTAGLLQDPHLWPLTLFDELLELGFSASYPTLTREILGDTTVAASCSTGYSTAPSS